MEIKNPKHILVISPPAVSIRPILNALTPNATPSPSDHQTPSAESAATEMLVHKISNSYYSASVPIWTDEVQDVNAWAEQWKADEGAADVIHAVGAWVVVFHKPEGEADKTALASLLTNISSVVNTETPSSNSQESPDTDALLIAIAVPKSPSKPTSSAAPSERSSTMDLDLDLDLEIDDICLGAGNWEYIDGTLPSQSTPSGSTTSASQLNEFGERTGIPRLLEALQSGDWEAAANDEDVDLADFADFSKAGDGEDDFDSEPAFGDVPDGFGDLLAAGSDPRAELLPKADRGDRGEDDANDGDADDETWRVRAGRNPTTGVDASIVPDEWATDDDVESLQKMMLRLQAARDLGADLPIGERRRVAALAVGEVMKDLK